MKNHYWEVTVITPGWPYDHRETVDFDTEKQARAWRKRMEPVINADQRPGMNARFNLEQVFTTSNPWRQS